MRDGIIPIRSAKQHRPIGFDVGDRERLIARMTVIFHGYWRSVQQLQKKYPATGFAKRVLQAAAMAEETGTRLLSEPGFNKTVMHDAFGTVIKLPYVDKNGWIDNLWFSTAAAFN